MLWQAAPREFGFNLPQKGILRTVVLLHRDPSPNDPVVELLWAAATLITKPPLPAGPADTLDVNGDKVVPLNTDILVPLLVVRVIAAKAEVMAAKKEKTWIIVYPHGQK